MTAIIDPVARIRQTLSRALAGCTYQGSHRDDERSLVIDARRADGRHLGLRFLGLKSSEVDQEPAAGASMKLLGVGRPGGFITLLLPPMLRTPSHTARVRIGAGESRLEIVCEDVEWWED